MFSERNNKMLTVTGKYNTAKVFTDIIEESAIAQLKELCNQSFVEGCKIRIMPDVHTGSSCVIGFTADLGKKVIPNIVGVDIGCGMLTVNLGKESIDFDKLDRIIIREIPSGKELHKLCPAHFGELENLHCYKNLKLGNIEKGLGTLGGGNHFIEVDEDDDGNKYLVIHSGSRNLGKQVAEYYQNMAVEIHRGIEEYEAEKKRVIAEYRATGRGEEIEPVLKKMKKEFAGFKPGKSSLKNKLMKTSSGDNSISPLILFLDLLIAKTSSILPSVYKNMTIKPSKHSPKAIAPKTEIVTSKFSSTTR